MVVLFVPNQEQTAKIGAVIAGHLVPGDTLTLVGDLGAGKTALARAIIRARLGEPALEVPSPSFAIVQPYPGIIHADLYRIVDEAEIFELGILDDEEAIVLVEWAQNAPILFDRPGVKLTVTMSAEGTGRDVAIAAQAGRDIAGLVAALAPWRRADAN